VIITYLQVTQRTIAPRLLLWQQMTLWHKHAWFSAW